MPQSELTPRARDLRVNQTSTERLLWAKLRNRKLGGWKWKRQVPRGPYIVDFLCIEAKLVVELDGGQHADNVAYDSRRTAFLEGEDLTVLRFWNHHARENLSAVCDEIYRACGGDCP